MRVSRLRFFLSTTLVILFFVISFLVLFFSFGYRFSFERGIFIHTGSITIKSNPKDVRILIDGNDVPPGLINIVNQSYHITGLRPGEHFLRIEADGYRPWERKIAIQSGISTEFWNILLLRETYPVTEIASGNFQEIFPSPEQRYLALIGNTKDGTTVDVLEKGSGDVTRVATMNGYRFDTESSENIEWTEDGSEFLLPLRTEQGGNTVFIIDRETGVSIDVRILVGSEEPLRGARWHPKSDGSFFVLSGSSLLLLHPKETDSARRIITIGTDISAYDLSEKYIYLLDRTTGSIQLLSIGDKENPSARILTTPFPEAIAMRQPLINAYDEKRIILYEVHGKGLLWNDTGEIDPEVISLGDDIRSVQFSNDGKKVLYSDGSQISVFFPRDWDTQPLRKAGESVQVARFSSPFSSVEWSKNYEHILFSTGADIRIAELDHRDRRQMETLLSSPGKIANKILPSFDENLVMFLVQDEHSEVSRILSIAFPEDSGLFGN